MPLSRNCSSSKTKTLSPVNSNSPFCLPPAPGNHLLLVFPVSTISLYTSRKWNHPVFVLLWLAYLGFPSLFIRRPWQSKWLRLRLSKRIWSLVRELRSKKRQNIKQKQYCNKFNKDVKKKNGPHKKRLNIIIYCMYISYFLYPFILPWTLGLLPLNKYILNFPLWYFTIKHLKNNLKSKENWFQVS